MRDPKRYIEEGLKTIKLFYKKGQYRSALAGCEELLKFDPENTQARTLLKRIREAILKVNEKYVEQKIRETEPLWAEQRFEELIRLFQNLKAYTPENKRLQKLIEKAVAAARQKYGEERKVFFQKAEAVIKSVYEQKRYGDTIQACNELLQLDALNETAKTYREKARAELVEQKLRENERIVDSGDYQAALGLYESLRALAPDSKKLRALIEDAKRHCAEQEAIQHRVAINRGIVRIKKFFHEQAYEKVLQSCEEVLQYDNKNFIAKLYASKVCDILDQEIDHMVMRSLRESQKLLAAQAQKTPELFVRIY